MKIKILVVTTAVALFTSMATQAADKVVVEDNYTANAGATGESWWESHMYYERENKPLFHANELTLDFFGAYRANEGNIDDLFKTNIRHGKWGGGVGLNYFPIPYLGIGVDSAFIANTRNFANHVVGSLQLRLPIEPAHLAPYVFGGGGYYFNPESQWGAHVGVGLDFRFNPHLGIFADSRFIWMNKTSNEILFRSGLRVGF